MLSPMPVSRLEDQERSRAPQRPRILFELMAIGLGGSIGACLRLAVVIGFEHAGWGSAIAATFATNLLGSFLLGALLSALAIRAPHPLLHPFLAVGVLGSFTTFSSFALQSVLLARTDIAGAAPVYVAGSLGLGLVAFLGGGRLLQRQSAEARG